MTAHEESNSNWNRNAVVSVIVPAYNAAAYIAETLDSVFCQTYPHFEVIVVNDGSPDTPLLELVLSPYLERITYIKQENRGLAGARNTGLRAATGAFVALLDADDLWMHDYLEQQTNFLYDNPGYDMVYCDALFFGDSVHDGKLYMDLFPSAGEATAAAIISRRCHVYVSVTARTEGLRTIGFDESLRSCEDFDCWIRFTASGRRIGYQRKVLVRYRKHSTSLSANIARMAEFNIQVLTNSLALWPPGSEESELLLKARAAKTAELQTIYGKLALREGRISAAVEHLRTANEFYHSAKKSAVIFLLGLAPGVVRAAYQLRRSMSRAYRDA